MKTPSKVAKHFSDKVDLGKSHEVMPGNPAQSGEDTKSYPHLSIEVPPGCKCGVGDEGHAMVHYHVKGASEQEPYGKEGGPKTKRLEMHVKSIAFPGDDSSEENDGKEDDNGVQDGRLSASMAKLMKSQG